MKFIIAFILITGAYLHAQIQPLIPGQNGMQAPAAQPAQELDPELIEAIEKYENLKQQYPELPSLNYNLANLKYLSGDFQSAQQEYQSALADEDPTQKSHALYNLGNTLFKQGQVQESIDFYRQAMELNPQDEDIKYNYEISKQILQQQQQQQQSQDSDKSEDEEEQEDQEQQQQQSEGEKQQDEENKQDQQDQESEEEQEEGERDKQSEEQQEEEEQESQQEQPTPQQQEMTEEEQLGKEEAEAILNALKASEENLMKKKYRSSRQIKVEKDW